MKCRAEHEYLPKLFVPYGSHCEDHDGGHNDANDELLCYASAVVELLSSRHIIYGFLRLVKVVKNKECSDNFDTQLRRHRLRHLRENNLITINDYTR